MFAKTATTVISIVIIVPLVSCTLVDQCENATPMPNYVTIEGCQQPPCRFQKGSEVVISLNFTLGHRIEEFETKTEIKYLHTGLSFVVSEPNGCQGLINTHCPLEENEPAFYKQKIQVADNKSSSDYFIATFRMMYNKNRNEFVCFKVMFLVV